MTPNDDTIDLDNLKIVDQDMYRDSVPDYSEGQFEQIVWDRIGSVPDEIDVTKCLNNDDWLYPDLSQLPEPIRSQIMDLCVQYKHCWSQGKYDWAPSEVIPAQDIGLKPDAHVQVKPRHYSYEERKIITEYVTNMKANGAMVVLPGPPRLQFAPLLIPKSSTNEKIEKTNLSLVA